jgi:hypothetical protein
MMSQRGAIVDQLPTIAGPRPKSGKSGLAVFRGQHLATLVTEIAPRSLQTLRLLPPLTTALLLKRLRLQISPLKRSATQPLKPHRYSAENRALTLLRSQKCAYTLACTPALMAKKPA